MRKKGMIRGRKLGRKVEREGREEMSGGGGVSVKMLGESPLQMVGDCRKIIMWSAGGN